MKGPENKARAAADELTTQRIVRSIADCQRKAAAIGLTPSAKERNMLAVYHALYDSRKALLESLKEGQPELWTDFLDSRKQQRLPVDSSARAPDKNQLLAELSDYREQASRLAKNGGPQEQALRLAYDLLARHRRQQLEILGQEHGAHEEHTGR